jgi:hypothetical protein
MLKVTVAVLAMALAATANAAGWRSLRIDGSSEASFEKSVATFRQTLSPARRYVFDMALLDIQRDPAAGDYRRLLHGMGYKEVVKVTDPTGETADKRYEAALRGSKRPYTGPAFTPSPGFQQSKPPNENGVRGALP